MSIKLAIALCVLPIIAFLITSILLVNFSQEALYYLETPPAKIYLFSISLSLTVIAFLVLYWLYIVPSAARVTAVTWRVLLGTIVSTTVYNAFGISIVAKISMLGSNVDFDLKNAGVSPILIGFFLLALCVVIFLHMKAEELAAKNEIRRD